MNWQPIETAPMDGTKFDAWCIHPKNPGLGVRFVDVQMRRDKSGFGYVVYLPYDEVFWQYLDARDPDSIFPAWQPTHWMHQPPPPGEAVAPAVKVKPLEWSEDHGDGYRIFYANTPVGRFAFGTDKFGQSYWQGNTTMGLGKDVASEAEAEKEAQAAYAAAIMETDIFKCLNLVQEGEPGEQPEESNGFTEYELMENQKFLDALKVQPDAVQEAREAIIDEIEEIISETHDMDVTDRDYAENIVGWLRRHHPAALRALEGGE